MVLVFPRCISGLLLVWTPVLGCLASDAGFKNNMQLFDSKFRRCRRCLDTAHNFWKRLDEQLWTQGAKERQKGWLPYVNPRFSFSKLHLFIPSCLHASSWCLWCPSGAIMTGCMQGARGRRQLNSSLQSGRRLAISQIAWPLLPHNPQVLLQIRHMVRLPSPRTRCPLAIP